VGAARIGSPLPTHDDQAANERRQHGTKLKFGFVVFNFGLESCSVLDGDHNVHRQRNYPAGFYGAQIELLNGRDPRVGGDHRRRLATILTLIHKA
jgi:hypothetical protein